jgi:hypothetical protein
MTHISYSDLYESADLGGLAEVLEAGDIVRTGANLFPHYEVIAVRDGKAWVRNLQSGEDGLAEVARCRKINGPSRLMAD